MKIIVFGKDGCGKCEAAKGKLKLLGFEYEERILADAIEPHEGWREDDTSGIMAAHSDLDTMPIIRIGEKYYDYSSAMKLLKQIRKGMK
ncbi:MAG: glutaredoxin [Planctomycetes bacterium]|nr:glutaredoxin [Planctomycetota bacterium]